jgi:hypothetical protein
MYVRHEQEVVNHVLELAASGVPKLRIAHAVELSPTTVRRWIQSGGVRVGRPPPCTVDVCPTRDAVDPFAYAYVLGLYLGDGHIVRSQRTYRIEISCDPKYPGIIAEATTMLGRVLPMNRVLTRQRPSVILVGCYSNHLPCLFPQHGPGLKHHRPIVLAPWQREIALGSEAGTFLRGLIHSDGWRGINRVRGANGSRYEYPRYMFSNRSDDIRGLFAEACDAIGVHARRMNQWNLSVADAEGIRRLDRFVGPKY